MRPTCPECRSREVIPIVYGLPSVEVAERDGIELGGCIVDPESPRWRCRGCGEGFVLTGGHDPIGLALHVAETRGYDATVHGDIFVCRRCGGLDDRSHADRPSGCERHHVGAHLALLCVSCAGFVLEETWFCPDCQPHLEYKVDLDERYAEADVHVRTLTARHLDAMGADADVSLASYLAWVEPDVEASVAALLRRFGCR